MPRLYLSRVIGDGTRRTNPYRSAADDHRVSYSVIELPSNQLTGAPLKNWVLLVVENPADYAILDADPDLAALSDLVDLDTTVTTAVRNRVNNAFGRYGITTVAVVGETFRALANRLLAELGSTVRL